MTEEIKLYVLLGIYLILVGFCIYCIYRIFKADE